MKFKKFLSPYMGLPRAIYILTLAKVVNALGAFVMPLMTIIMTDSIGLSPMETGLYISLGGIAYLPASLLGGKLTDVINRKIIAVVCNTLAALVYVVCGFIEPTITLVYLMILSGAFMTMAVPAQDAMIADLTTPETRDGAFSLSYLGWNIGFALGPIIGGILYSVNLKYIFIGDAVTAFASVLLMAIFIKDTKVLAETQVFDEDRSLETQVQGSILKVLWERPILIVFSLLSFGYSFAYSQWGFILPMQIMAQFENGSSVYGTMAGFNGLIVVLFTPILTKLVMGKAPLWRISLGGLAYILGFGLFAIVEQLAMFFLCVYIFTLGEILISISTPTFLANHTPASHRGRMNAVLPIIWGTGFMMGPLVMGRVIESNSIEYAWTVTALVLAVSTVLMWGLYTMDRKETEKIESLERE